MKFYVYCVADELSHFHSSDLGVAGQKIELLSLENLVVVSSRFDDDVVKVTRENVLKHDAVVRGLLYETTPLPFRFGTLVSEDRLRSFVVTRRTALNDRLKLVRGCVEMSVKIIWAVIGEPSESLPDNLSSVHGVGATFLRGKQREMRGDENLSRKAREIEEWLIAGLDGWSKQSQVNVEPRQKLVLSGAYLVDKTLEADFRAKINGLQAERTDLHFLTSGPWPPYTFANIDLEFETHFGVS